MPRYANACLLPCVALLMGCLAGSLAAQTRPAPTGGQAPRPLALGVTFSTRSLLGALVVDVYPGSPAQQAGLQPGDRILEANGQPINDWQDAQRIVSAARANSELNLLVQSDGERRVVSPRLGRWIGVATAPSAAAARLLYGFGPPLGPPAPSSAQAPNYSLDPAYLDDQHAYGG